MAHKLQLDCSVSPILPEGSPFELWDVRLMSGDLTMTIDELDAAFNAGRLDASTLVRRRGTVRWTTLREAANLDEVELEVEVEVEVEVPSLPSVTSGVDTALGGSETALGDEKIEVTECLRPKKKRSLLFLALTLTLLAGVASLYITRAHTKIIALAHAKDGPPAPATPTPPVVARVEAPPMVPAVASAATPTPTPATKASPAKNKRVDAKKTKRRPKK